MSVAPRLRSYATAHNTPAYYKPIESFSPVTQVGQTPLIITGHPKVPAKTLNELIAYGRANPGKLTYASVGNGSLGHLAAELFSLETGVKMVHVAYRGISQASLDLVSGQYDLAFSNIGSLPPSPRGSGDPAPVPRERGLSW